MHGHPISAYSYNIIAKGSGLANFCILTNIPWRSDKQRHWGSITMIKTHGTLLTIPTYLDGVFTSWTHMTRGVVSLSLSARAPPTAPCWPQRWCKGWLRRRDGGGVHREAAGTAGRVNEGTASVLTVDRRATFVRTTELSRGRIARWTLIAGDLGRRVHNIIMMMFIIHYNATPNNRSEETILLKQIYQNRVKPYTSTCVSVSAN